MGSEDKHRGDELLAHARRSLEDHERELLDQLLERVWRDIPPGATVGEAGREIERAATEDEDARELLMRARTLGHENNGYLRAHFIQDGAPADNMEPQYQFALAGKPQAREALQLMELIGVELEKRLPADLSIDEREARIVELLSEDPRLNDMAVWLDRLFGGSLSTPDPDL
ncbi:MAG: hypothetical protein ACTHK3_04980 [Solirubrobacterales bacterium]